MFASQLIVENEYSKDANFSLEIDLAVFFKIQPSLFFVRCRYIQNKKYKKENTWMPMTILAIDTPYARDLIPQRRTMKKTLSLGSRALHSEGFVVCAASISCKNGGI